LGNSKLFRVACVLLLIFSLAIPSGLAGAEPVSTARGHESLEQPAIAEAKIHADVLTAFESEEFVHVLIKLREQADPKQAADAALEKLPRQTTAYNRKMAARYAVVNALRETAARTQGPLLDFLAAEQSRGNVQEVNGYYIVNLIHACVKESVVEELAKRPDVDVILPSRWVEMEWPQVMDNTVQQDGPGRQWNLEYIEAYAVWDAYGLDGTGVVVGMIDTGTHLEHEALQQKWRGYDPQGNHDPIYNWFDAVEGRPMPYDINDINYCHGTHVMGTILGGHSETNNLIGVAPGAKWITARAFIEEGGYDHWLLAAGQYLLAPTDADGEPNPAMAPDVINNSWGGGPGLDEWYRPMVQAWREAKIVPVFSAGNTNTGSVPGSVSNPGNYPESIAVAATDNQNLRANFSNQGPGPYDDDLKPDLSAPGVAIRSSVIGGYSASWSGTSMAAPHVTGTVALLLQANAGLTVDEIEEILAETAMPLTDSQYPVSPNYGYGEGLVNAFDAVTAVVGGFGTIHGQVLADGKDTEPPVIQHTPVDLAFVEYDVPITATISDDVAVIGADLFVKLEGAEYWIVIPMERSSGNHKSGEYIAYVPWMFVQEPGFTYKIVARDWGSHSQETPEYYTEVVFGLQPGVAIDFEEYPVGWYWDGDWQWGEPSVGPQPQFGTRLFATNLHGNYSNYSDSWLLSPPLDLRNASEASFRVKHWYDIEANYDFGVVAVTADYGETWEEIGEFSSRSQEWQNLMIDLNSYAGTENQVYVLFAFMSDVSVNYPGWYIDYIDYVGEDTEAPATPVGLEASAGIAGINLTWQAVPDMDVSGYAVYRSETAGEGHVKIAQCSDPAYRDVLLEAGKEYFYVVTAVDYSGNESEFSAEASAVAPAITLALYADFEADDGGFVSGGAGNTWEWGVPTSGPESAHSGSNVWATNLAGTYSSNAECWLETPPVDLSGCSSAILEFAHWHNLEQNWDFGLVQVSGDGGETWEEAASFTGVKEDWSYALVPLDAYAGGTVSIRFVQTSDGSINRLGWYIDDVTVLGLEESPDVAPPAAPAPGTGQKKEATVRPAITRPLRRDPSEYTWYRSDEERPQSASMGLPVDAVVTVVESGRSVRTDPATGVFHMVHPATPGDGTWTIRVEAYGYHIQEIPFTLEEGQVLEINPLMEAIPRGAVSGTVTCSRTGEPIAGAIVVLAEDARIPWAYTDLQGNFQIGDVLEGDYTLKLSAQGYHGAEMAITVEGGKTTEIQAALKPFIGYEDEIAYDDGVAENARAFYDGNNGWGVRFTPNGMAQIIGASVYTWGNDWPSPGDNKVAVAVFDSLPDGSPGAMVIEPFIVEGTRGAWTFIDLSSFGFSTNRDFYIISVQIGNYPDCAGLGFDESSSAGRTYEWFGGEFAPVTPDYGNAMVRAHVQYELSEPVLTSPADGAHTNVPEIAVAGRVDMDSLVTIYVNGEEAAQTQAENGLFEAVVTLEDGENVITATAEIATGVTDPSQPVTVVLDRVVPEVAVEAPEDGFITNKQVVTVSGHAFDQYLAKILVNGSPIEFAPDGSFSTKVMLDEGENTIVVEALDLAGNTGADSVTVHLDTAPPLITDIEPSADLRVKAGQEVEVSFFSDTVGGTASFTVALPGMIPVSSHRTNMTEESPGFYKGTWVVPDKAYFKDAVVEIELVDAAGNRAAATAPGKLSTAAPPSPPPPPPPAENPEITRISGSTRFHTAVAISQAGWQQADVVVLARADDFADALAGVPLAHKLDAPILLTGSQSLHPLTKGEIARLGATKVIILGGEKVIADAVAEELQASGVQVERIGGANRYATALAIARKFAPEGVGSAAVVSGHDFPDALSVAPYAALAGMPVLPVGQDSAVVLTALSELGVARTLVIGGTAVIGDDLMAQLPGATRIAGANRYATSAALAEYFGLAGEEVFIASGNSFADAITGAVLAAKRGSGLLLVGDTVPPAIAAYLAEADYSAVVILGGQSAVNADIQELLLTMLR
jgi:bacillopeptidase F (M6 metalloprotease family)/putative cell wall-binding protein/subtilisin family serine protease